jgi:uncharacterized protein (DUF1015 family)
MAIIRPFRALRPHNEFAEDVASRPYDVLNSEEAKTEAGDNLLSFLHITKAEIDLPAGTDIHDQSVYDKAKQNLDMFMQKNILFRDQQPCYYIYQLSWKGRSQTGLVCLSSVEDYFNDVIKKHEFTRPEKEKDRIDHMFTVRAQTGNVFLACKDIKDLDDVFEHWKKHNNAEYHFTAPDGVVHTIWVVNTPSTIDVITNIFKDKVPQTYIADGHHRAASASKVSQRLPESVEAKYFLTTIFPANQLAIMDYNRLIKDLNGLSSAEFLSKLQSDFEVTEATAAVRPAEPHQFGMYLENKWYQLKAKPGTFSNDPIGVLDITILSEKVLDKILGIKDQRTDPRIDFVGGIRGLEELEKRVNTGEMKLAFSLHPVTMQQLFDIADSGEVMPPKTTWFEPKLRDGLLTHLI